MLANGLVKFLEKDHVLQMISQTGKKQKKQSFGQVTEMS